MKNDDDETKQLFDLIGRMLEYDPVERIDLEEALKHPYFNPPEKTSDEDRSSTPREQRNSKSR